MLIYKVTNVVNGKVYIGQTQHTVEKRWALHIQASKNKKLTSTFHAAIRKYGKESFVIQKIGEARTTEELNELEINCIRFYNCLVPNGYNITTGGKGVRGFKFSADAKRRLSNLKKLNLTPSVLEILRIGRERTISIEERKSISERMSGENNPMFGISLVPHNLGKSPSVATRLKMTNSHKLRWERRKKANNAQA